MRVASTSPVLVLGNAAVSALAFSNEIGTRKWLLLICVTCGSRSQNLCCLLRDTVGKTIFEGLNNIPTRSSQLKFKIVRPICVFPLVSRGSREISEFKKSEKGIYLKDLADYDKFVGS